MIMISNNLMQEILVTIKAVQDVEIIDKTLIKWYGTTYGGSYTKGVMNVYEVAHKLKIWALNHNVEIDSSTRSKSEGVATIYYSAKTNNTFKSSEFYQETETEAIIEACEYILNKGL